MNSLRYLILIVLAMACFLNTLAQKEAKMASNLTQVVSRFCECIAKKDSLEFNYLFFDDNVPFVGVMSEKSERSIQKDYPDFQGIAVSDSKKFIREISQSDKAQFEEVYNLEFFAEEKIASISFVYVFYSDQKVFQWGHEKWNLVRIEDDWLINNVIYSIHLPEVEPIPNDNLIQLATPDSCIKKKSLGTN